MLHSFVNLCSFLVSTFKSNRFIEWSWMVTGPTKAALKYWGAFMTWLVCPWQSAWCANLLDEKNRNYLDGLLGKGRSAVCQRIQRFGMYCNFLLFEKFAGQTCHKLVHQYHFLLQYLVRPSPTWHDHVLSEALLASFALHGSLLPGWIGVELKLQVLGLVAGMILHLKQRVWLMSLKRACRSARSRTPPELIRVQCESSYDGETGSCGSSQSSESGSSTSSSSESSSSPTESHSQTAYDAAERELILVSYGAGGVPVLYTLTKPKSVACSVHSKLGVARISGLYS